MGSTLTRVSIGLLIAAPTTLWAQDAPQQSSAAEQTQTDDVAAIRASAQEFAEAFNRKDAAAIAAKWTADGEFIDDSGRKLVGREAIEHDYAAMFEESGDAKIRIMVDSVRLLSSDAAIEDGRAYLDPAPAGAPGFGKYAAVHVKQDGKWLMASVRDSRVETPSAHQNVADLEWLIGTWVAEENGSKMESACRWVANKSFVERKYTTTFFDGAQTSGVQIIGWNAYGGHVQSWNFSPDGGHAVGIWTPQENGWMAQMQGVTGDGVITSSLNHLIRLDDNAYVWQSVQRMADDIALPDTGEVVLTRQSPDQ